MLDQYLYRLVAFHDLSASHETTSNHLEPMTSTPLSLAPGALIVDMLAPWMQATDTSQVHGSDPRRANHAIETSQGRS